MPTLVLGTCLVMRHGLLLTNLFVGTIRQKCSEVDAEICTDGCCIDEEPYDEVLKT